MHREAGAAEVLVASANRWALMYELRSAHEPSLAELLTKCDPVDLVIVEGFKTDAHVKLEVHRLANNKPFLFLDDPFIKAVANDLPDAASVLPARLRDAHLDDIDAIAALVLELASPLEATMAQLVSRPEDK